MDSETGEFTRLYPSYIHLISSYQSAIFVRRLFRRRNCAVSHAIQEGCHTMKCAGIRSGIMEQIADHNIGELPLRTSTAFDTSMSLTNGLLLRKVHSKKTMKIASSSSTSSLRRSSSDPALTISFVTKMTKVLPNILHLYPSSVAQ